MNTEQLFPEVVESTEPREFLVNLCRENAEGNLYPSTVALWATSRDSLHAQATALGSFGLGSYVEVTAFTEQNAGFRWDNEADFHAWAKEFLARSK